MLATQISGAGSGAYLPMQYGAIGQAAANYAPSEQYSMAMPTAPQAPSCGIGMPGMSGGGLIETVLRSVLGALCQFLNQFLTDWFSGDRARSNPTGNVASGAMAAEAAGDQSPAPSEDSTGDWIDTGLKLAKGAWDLFSGGSVWGGIKNLVGAFF